VLFDVLFLFGAGFLGGVINSLAGGGSFITFPALLVVGVPPVSANATNTFALCAGYLSGTYAFRDDLYAHKKALIALVLVSLVGGSLGAWLLLQTPESLFREAIPWLLLFATVLFVFGNKLNYLSKQISSHHKYTALIGHSLLFLMLLGVSAYGGFFNAGLGIIVLSYLALAGHHNINTMNGMKLLISSAVSIIAIVLFIYNGVIAWYEGTVVLIGTLLGGYMAAYVSKQLPQQSVRFFVILASGGMTTYFFFETYAT
jgi:uncharacterized membrane protein YfcA